MQKNMPALIDKATSFSQRRAVCSDGQTFSYADLLQAAEMVAQVLLQGLPDLAEKRVAFMVPPGFDYVRVQWGIWMAGGVAVPLCTSHPLPALQYVIEDAEAEMVIIAPEYAAVLAPLWRKHKKIIEIHLAELDGGNLAAHRPLPHVAPDRRAMILYTSGTTSKPKGVVHTHANIESQISTLVQAWEWHEDDHILCVLPLHHVHGIINVVGCALRAGACCTFLPKFSAADAYAAFLEDASINLFMAVPTIYYQLIQYFEAQDEAGQKMLRERLKAFRLMVSGSAALPVSVLEKWKAISGHTLLERYGMTEIGMALSNPYRGERRPGHVGQPLPGVAVRLIDERGEPAPEGLPGEIQVQGPNVFREYWGKPHATAEAFSQGWFRTGDIAVWDRDSYRILGRNSVDIIKSGGYKISALEIEEVLRTHPLIKDCGVVGLPSEEWGETIGAALVLRDMPPDPETLKSWLLERLPAYKLPRKFIALDDLPRNTLGKVTKNTLKDLF